MRGRVYYAKLQFSYDVEIGRGSIPDWHPLEIVSRSGRVQRLKPVTPEYDLALPAAGDLAWGLLGHGRSFSTGGQAPVIVDIANAASLLLKCAGETLARMGRI